MIFWYNFKATRARSSVVERLICNEEISGPIPLGSTKIPPQGGFLVVLRGNFVLGSTVPVSLDKKDISAMIAAVSWG